MTQNAAAAKRFAAEELPFEGIGPYTPYTQRTFRQAPAPEKPVADTGDRIAPPLFLEQTRPSRASTLAPVSTESLAGQTYVSSRCYEVGVSLLILASGAAALFRLVWLGQP